MFKHVFRAWDYMNRIKRIATASPGLGRPSVQTVPAIPEQLGSHCLPVRFPGSRAAPRWACSRCIRS